MSALDDLVARHRPAGGILIARAVAVLIVLLAAWSLLARLDEVAVATGRVVPQGDVKVIQHLEGGIVEELLVQEGSRVATGDPLLRLKLGLDAQNPQELSIRVDGLLLRRARLQAEAAGTTPEFPPEPARRRPDVLQAEHRAFEARRSELVTAQSVFDQQISQSEQETAEYVASRRARQRELELATESLNTLRDLARDNLASRLEVNQKEGELTRLAGDIDTLAASIARAQARRREAQERKQEAVKSFRREAQAEMAEVEVQLAGFRERLAGADEQARRTVIQSPIDGVVGNLKFRTIGGVVAPGQPIMEIVPVGGPLVVEAELSPTDRGFVAEGQRATVKVSSYDFVRYGALEGRVVRIAPDANVDPNGRPYFKVVVETDKDHLGDSAGQFPIGAGMEATVDIHTGSRSVADFLLRPVLKLRHEAFRER
ncbi:MAG: HlyD family type I secretion periplasmic adaptor subunit [Pseudomonadota bacterium]|nr:HlyD family type I secretion periplasmic adaptor subunit [Pseudomonadota bacterium]